MTKFIRSLLLLLAATTSTAFTPLGRPALHRPRTRPSSALPATLDTFLQSLSVVGTARAIVMRPGPEAILEATVSPRWSSLLAMDNAGHHPPLSLPATRHPLIHHYDRLI